MLTREYRAEVPVSGRATAASFLEPSDPGRGEARTHSTEHEGHRPLDVTTGSHKQVMGRMHLMHKPGSSVARSAGNPFSLSFGGNAALGAGPLATMNTETVLGGNRFGSLMPATCPLDFLMLTSLGCNPTNLSTIR